MLVLLHKQQENFAGMQECIKIMGQKQNTSMKFWVNSDSVLFSFNTRFKITKN